MNAPRGTNGRNHFDAHVPFLNRVRIRNYKSIGHCDLALGALTVLVGRNGSGKSNFLDALRFVVDGLRTSLDHAIKSRGGIDEVRRRSTGHPRNFALELEMNLGQGRTAIFGFEVAARSRGGFSVKKELLRIQAADSTVIAQYNVEDGKLVRSSDEPIFPALALAEREFPMPPAAHDRLYLVNASGLPEFRPVYDALLMMGFYNLNPGSMKALQSPDAGAILHRDGGNIASVIARIEAEKPELKERIQSYLATIVPGMTDFGRRSLGPKETLEFRHEVAGSASPWKFYAASMSDGTLRALGALVAVSQLAEGNVPVSLVGIEEPETALHPAASGALMDALREAATHTQVVVATHSPELLDQLDAETDCLLCVEARQGNTVIGPIDPASRDAIKEHLFTAGVLLRMDQLEPDRNDLARQKQLSMFERVGSSG